MVSSNKYIQKAIKPFPYQDMEHLHPLRKSPLLLPSQSPTSNHCFDWSPEISFTCSRTPIKWNGTMYAFLYKASFMHVGSVLHSFLLWRRILLYKYTTICSSTDLLLDFLIVSSVCLLRISCYEHCMYKSLCRHVFLSFV